MDLFRIIIIYQRRLKLLLIEGADFTSLHRLHAFTLKCAFVHACTDVASVMAS